MEPRGFFSMAVPAKVLAAALAEDGSRRSRPGAVPDYCFTVDVRRMLYDVKRISFCPTRYWPTVAVASSRGSYGVRGGSLRARRPDSGLVHSDGDRRPSRSTSDGSRYPCLVSSGSRLGLRQHRLRGGQGGRRPPCSGCVVVCPASVALAWRPLHARRAVLHDLDAALSGRLHGRLRRGRGCACPSPPLASRAHWGLWPHRRPLRICRARLHFAYRLRAGAGRRSGSGWRQGRVRCRLIARGGLF